MDISGILKQKGEAVQISEKFKKLDFVITTEEQYPQHIAMQLTQDRCALLDKYKAGDKIKAFINIKGREWTSPQGEVKHFNTIEAWKIEGLSWSEPIKVPSETGIKAEDDLPF